VETGSRRLRTGLGAAYMYRMYRSQSRTDRLGRLSAPLGGQMTGKEQRALCGPYCAWGPRLALGTDALWWAD
jgi:hypothetical protein